jgi:hypothetical protein
VEERLTQSALNLARLALDKEADAIMLLDKYAEQKILETRLGFILLAGNGNGYGFPPARGSVVFNQGFDAVVIDIFCKHGFRRQRADSTIGLGMDSR